MNKFRLKSSLVLAFLALALSLSTACQVKASNTSSAASTASVSPTSATDNDAAYKRILAVEAEQRIASGDPVVILDVRTATEYKGGYVKGAINLPLDLIAQEASKQLPDKNAEILVYCHSGRRSEIAAKQLIEMGYTKVFDFGGIDSWPGEISR